MDTEVSVNLAEKGQDFLKRLETLCDLVVPKGEFNKRRKIVQTFSTKKASTSFTNLTPCSLKLVRETLVAHRFWEALRILEAMCLNVSEHTSGIYMKSSLHVLENVKHEITRDIIEHFYRNATGFKEVDKKELLLEYLIFRLKNGQFEFPGEFAQHVRPQRLVLRKGTFIEALLECYTTLFDYITWYKTVLDIENPESNDGEVTDVSEKIISAWSKAIVNPGIWDIFVEKTIQILQSKNDQVRCIEVLDSYLKTHPKHLNAYVYLELYRNDKNSPERVKNLKNIANMSPSDQLVLDYVDILLEEEKVYEALKHLFSFLDYSVNKENLRGWETLAGLLFNIQQSEEIKRMLMLNRIWRRKSSYWVNYHFDADCISIHNKLQSKLSVQKCIFLCIILRSNDHHFVKRTCNHLKTLYPKRLHKLKSRLKHIKELNKKIYFYK